METLTLERGVVIDGYDLEAEKARYNFPDIATGGKRLNRGTARVSLAGPMEAPSHKATRDAHNAHMFLTTHDASGPVVELGYPVAGHFVACEAGTYLDVQLGVAQKVLDENHPALREAVRRVFQAGLVVRREINTDDFLQAGDAARGVRTPQELAALVGSALQARFPSPHGWRSFFCNSGAETLEAAVKLASIVKWRRLEEAHGAATIKELMRQLGIGEIAGLGRDPNPELVWADYPMFWIACEGSFHGRTLGALNLTRSRKVHQVSYPKSHWVRHIKYNGPPDSLEALLDVRPLPEILAAPGGVKAVIEAGKVPKDLAAAFVAEGFQGEGGYVPGDRRFFAGISATCRRHQIALVADEVQTFARTGRLFAYERLDAAPDIVCMAKAAYVGIMAGRGELSRYLHPGWHSNTWGGGKVLDVNIAHATIDALMSYEDPTFDGLSYMDNARIKGDYLRRLLDRVRDRHPRALTLVNGEGGMIGITVRDRTRFIETAWRTGIKLLGAGLLAEEARVRILLLADVLTREVEEIATTLDRTLAVMESR